MKKIMSLILVIVMVFCFAQTAFAADPIITAVNNDLMSLKSSTMPVKKYGEWYVPYKTLASGGLTENQLGIFISNNTEQKTLLVYNADDESLLFDLNANTVVGNDGTKYYHPAYYINNTIYLPLRIVCSKFGLSYSYISKDSYKMIRIVSSSKVSDELFASASSELAGKMVDTYNKSQTTTTPVKPVVPGDIEKDDVNTLNPALVRITFDGQLNQNVDSILRTLNTYNKKATFFADAGSIYENDSILREILAQGHNIGISISRNEFGSGEELVEKLNKANEDLYFTSGVTTRIIRITNDLEEPLDDNMLSAISDNGYRLWGYTLNCDYSSSNKIVTAALTKMRTTSAPVILRFTYSKSAAAGIQSVLQEINTRSLQTDVITENSVPKNSYGYIK